MQANLPSEQLQFLHAAVASGRYRDEAEALSEAVWLLKRRDELEQSLREASRELDEGRGFSEEEVFQHLEETISEIERQTKPNER